MSAHQGGSRRPRKPARRQSFKPEFDLLETRNLLSGLVTPIALPPVIEGLPIQLLDPLPFAGPVRLGATPNAGVVTATPDHLEITRGGDPGTFSLVLNSAPTADVTVTLAQFNLSLLATATVVPPPGGDGGLPFPFPGGDTKLTITPPHLTFTPQNWNTAQPVSVSAPAGDGSAYGASVWVFGTTSSADPNFDAQAVPPVTVTVVNPANTAGVTLSTDHLEVTRGGASDSYTVALASKPTADVTITITQFSPIVDPLPPPGSGTGTTPPTPGDNGPLTVTPATLTFTPDDWQTAQPVTVSAPADPNQFDVPAVLLLETVASQDPNYNNFPAPTVFVRVDDSSVGHGTLVLSTDQLKVTRGGGSDTFTVALASQPTADVTITIAQGSPDLQGWPSPRHNVALIVPPPVTNDPLQIAPTTLTFTSADWSTAQMVTVAPPTTGTGNQFDFLRLSASSSDTNYNNIDTPPVGVAVIDPAGLVVSQEKLDLKPGGSDSYTVALASKPSSDVTVTIAQAAVPSPLYVDGDGNLPPVTVGGDVQLTIAPTTLTFTPDDWNTAQPVTVTAPANVTGPAIAVLDQTVTSSDAHYNGLLVPPVFVTVEGSSTTTTTPVVVSTDHLELTRGGASDTFTVNLATQPTADVTITIAQTDPTLGPRSHDPLQIAPTTLTFTSADWSTAQTVTVAPPTTGSGDQFDFLSLSASSSDTNYNKIPIPPVGVTVIDTAGLVVSQEKLDLKPGGSDSYTVALASKPSSDVTVTIAQAATPLVRVAPAGPLPPVPVGGDVQLTIAPTTLTFTPDDWNTAQPVTVTAPADAAGPAFAVVEEKTASSDTTYDGLQGPSVFVYVEGSSTTTTNPGGAVLSKDHLEVTRGGSNDSYTLALTSQPAGDVTVTIAQVNSDMPPPGALRNAAGVLPPVADGHDPLSIAPATLTFTAADWSTPQTVTVAPPTTGSGNQSDYLVETAASSDPNYNVRLPSLSVAVIDPAGLVLSKDHVDLTAGGSDSYTVTLASKPTADVTVTITPADVPGATLPGGVSVPLEPAGAGPVTLTTTTLTFTPDDWNTPQPVTLTAPADATGPGAGSLTETVASSDPSYDGLQAPSVSVYLEGSSTTTTNSGSLVFNKQQLQVTPGTGSDSFTIALTSKPTANVTVTIAEGAGAVFVVPDVATTLGALPVPPTPPGSDVQLTITPITLTFTPDNWNMAQTVTVSAAASQDGTSPGGLESLGYTLKSDDPSYNGILVPSTSVFVVPAGVNVVPTEPPVLPPPLLPPIEVMPVAVQASVTVHGTNTGSGSHAGNKPSGPAHSTGAAVTPHTTGTTHHVHHGKAGKKPHHGKH
jgi:hypothetical protein